MSATTTTVSRRYSVLTSIGSGGMGQVFRAVDRLTEQQVALKRVTFDVTYLDLEGTDSGLNLRLALAREFRILASLRHPNIIGVQDYGFDSAGQPFFTMDLLDNAQDILKATRSQANEQRIRLVIQVLQALSYLHRRKVLHRDIKPSNMLVVDDQVKLLDFGLAVSSTQGRTDSAQTGTLYYMAPELLQEGSPSEQSDLYAVGVLMYEIFTGRHPFRTSSMTFLLEDILAAKPDLSNPALPPEVAEVIGRLMDKDRAQRCHSAVETIQLLADQTGLALNVETSGTRESFLQAAQLIGRAKELAQLQDALHELPGLQGSTWLVGGESGIGKSRLIDEIRVRGLVDGVQVLNGQAISEGGTPYYIWRRILAQLCLLTDLTDFEAEVIKPILPNIETLLNRPVSDPSFLEPQAAQERFIQVIGGLFARQQRRILVLLEDFHWAGQESLSLLQHLAKQIDHAPVMLVISFRTEESPTLPKQIPEAQYLRLARFSEAEITDLSVSMLGEIAERQREIVNLLTRETEGNALFIIEVVRTLAEEAGQLDRIGEITLPANVFSGGMQAVIARRLRGVSPGAMKFLEIASLAGRRIDTELMQGFLPSPELENWLTECSNAAVLDVQENQWRFAHDKLRESIITQLDGQTKQILHREIATQLEKLHGDDPAEAPMLAYHWGQAQNNAREYHFSVLAGEAAWRTNAYQDTLTYLNRALTLSASLDIPDFQKARLHYMIGDAHFSTGAMNEGSAALEKALVVLQIPSYSMPRVMGVVFEQVAHRIRMDLLPQTWHPHADVERLRLASRALEKLGQVYYVQNDTFRTLYAAFKGLNLSEILGDHGKAEQARFYAASSVAFGLLAPRAISNHYIALADRSIAQADNPDAAAWVMEATSAEIGAQWRWNDAFNRLQRCLAIARDSGQRRRGREGLAYYTSLLAFHADWKVLVTALDEFQRLVADGVDPQGYGWYCGARAMYALRRGDLDETRKIAQEGLDAVAHIQDPIGKLWLYGELLRANTRQDIQQAAPTAQLILDLISKMTPQAFYTLDAYVGLAEYALTAWEQNKTAEARAQAAKAIKLLAAYSKPFKMAAPSLLTMQAWRAQISGQQAVPLWKQAAEAAHKMELPFEEGLANYHLARLNPPERSAVDAAVKCFEAIGAKYELAQAQKLGGADKHD